MVSTLAQNYMIVAAWAPIADLNTAATTGAFVRVSNHQHWSFVGITNDVAAVVTYTFREATARAGTGAQDLSLTTEVHTMSNATDLDEDSLVYSRAAQDESVVTVSGSANLVVVDFESSMLTDGFDFISVNVSDPGAACIGAGLWILGGSRYGQDVIATVHLD